MLKIAAGVCIGTVAALVIVLVVPPVISAYMEQRHFADLINNAIKQQKQKCAWIPVDHGRSQEYYCHD